MGKQTQHCKAPNQQAPSCRYTGHRLKENALTWGDPGIDSVFLQARKSAEAIVPGSHEPRRMNVEGLTNRGRAEHQTAAMPAGSANWWKPPANAAGKQEDLCKQLKRYYQPGISRKLAAK